MASRVDLPHPDGPAMDRYSPLCTSMWMSARACVSTSSVIKTLLTASSLISDSEPLPFVMLSTSSSFYAESGALVQFNAVVTVIVRHIGKNDLISHL